MMAFLTSALMAFTPNCPEDALRACLKTCQVAPDGDFRPCVDACVDPALEAADFRCDEEGIINFLVDPPGGKLELNDEVTINLYVRNEAHRSNGSIRKDDVGSKISAETTLSLFSPFWQGTQGGAQWTQVAYEPKMSTEASRLESGAITITFNKDTQLKPHDDEPTVDGELIGTLKMKLIGYPEAGCGTEPHTTSWPPGCPETTGEKSW